MRTAGNAVAALCALAALALATVGIVRQRAESAFFAKAAQILGKVTEIHETPLDEHSAEHCPVVTIEPAPGKTAQFTDAVCTVELVHRIGDKVPVLYDPEDPSNGRIADGSGPWTAALPLLAGAALAAVVAAAVALLTRRFAD